jgi:hypothetical protein
MRKSNHEKPYTQTTSWKLFHRLHFRTPSYSPPLFVHLLYCDKTSFIFHFTSARSLLKTEAISSHKYSSFCLYSFVIVYFVTQAFRDMPQYALTLLLFLFHNNKRRIRWWNASTQSRGVDATGEMENAECKCSGVNIRKLCANYLHTMCTLGVAREPFVNFDVYVP